MWINDPTTIFWLFAGCSILIGIMGIFSLIVTYNLLRVLISLEIMIKAITLFLIAAGYLSGHTALAQGIVITVIEIEVVVMIIAAGLVVNTQKEYGSLSVKNLRNLKG